MIFISLGSQKFQFNRLLKKVDELITNGYIQEEIFAQIGYSTYSPQNYKFKNFLDREQFNRYIEKSDIVITHGGTGAIVNSLKRNKKVIAIARLAEYGEHVDNHQLDIVNMFKEMNYIEGTDDVGKIYELISNCKNTTYNKYISNTEKISNIIQEFILNL